MTQFLLVLVFISSCVYGHGLQVNTTEGVVEGYKATDGDYYEFYGIPYAGPTDGIHRFKAPVPPAPHSEVFHANVTNIRCAQPSVSGVIGVENCLTLDIFSNNFTTTRPVIVWLNAEDYTTTSTQVFSFRTFVEQDLVFVSVNFRLSIFGFLCLGIPEAPGNAGLRDVIQALKWINANIENFGGDPNNIVLMGHASGAAMVDLLTMAPQAKGLVHKAIALSGSGLAPWAVAYDPVGYAELLGAKLEYTGQSKEDLVKHLMATDITLLNSALTEFLHFKNNTPLFAPCIENISLNSNDTVLADAPLNILRSGYYLQTPYITGYTFREGTMRAKEAVYGDWLNAMSKNLTDFLPVDLALSGKEAADVTDKITNYYFKDHRPQATLINMDDYLKYEGDTLVATSVVKGAIKRSLTSKAEVRLFVFGTYNSDWTYDDIPVKGARHGAILNYLFDQDLKSNDKHVMKSIIKQFAVFAYTGTQNSTRSGKDWWPITLKRFFALYYVPHEDFGQFMVETNDHLLGLTTSFWDELYDKYYKPLKHTIPHDSTGNNNSIIASSYFIVIMSVMFLILCRTFKL